jgi:hypothetical protein
MVLGSIDRPSKLRQTYLRGGGRILVTHKSEVIQSARKSKRTTFNIVMMSFGTHVIKIREPLVSNCLEFLWCNLAIPILVNEIQNSSCDVFRLFLVLHVILRYIDMSMALVELAGEVHTLDFFCEYT